MKKITLLSAALLSISMFCSAQSPQARKIVNTLQGAGEPCRTPSGQNGRMYPQSTSTTTTTSVSNGSTRNSGSSSTTVSSGANISLTNGGLSSGISNTRTSGNTSNSNNTTTTTTTTVNRQCVPYNYWFSSLYVAKRLCIGTASLYTLHHRFWSGGILATQSSRFCGSIAAFLLSTSWPGGLTICPPIRQPSLE